MSQLQKSRFRIGFTGTRKGMTAEQIVAVREELRDQLQLHEGQELQAHHGDATGADSEFHRLCQELALRVVIHLPLTDHERAFCKGASEERPRMDFRGQSESIVNGTQILIAAPDGMNERLRGSGTWNIIRIGRKAGKTIVICYPDGSRETEAEE